MRPLRAWASFVLIATATCDFLPGLLSNKTIPRDKEAESPDDQDLWSDIHVARVVEKIKLAYGVESLSISLQNATTTGADEAGSFASSCVTFPTVTVGIRMTRLWRDRLQRLLVKFGLCAAYVVDRRCDVSDKQGADSVYLQRDGPSNRKPCPRSVDATAGHIRAMVFLLERGSAFGLILEEDAGLRVSPAQLATMVGAISRHIPFHYSMLGGCWNQHAGSFPDQKRNHLETAPKPVLSDLFGTQAANERIAGAAAATAAVKAAVKGSPLVAGPSFYPDGPTLVHIDGRLYEAINGSATGSRCAHAYLMSATAASLIVSDAVHKGVENTIDHHLNSVHIRNRHLSCTFVEPPVACQMRGAAGSMACYGYYLHNNYWNLSRPKQWEVHLAHKEGDRGGMLWSSEVSCHNKISGGVDFSSRSPAGCQH